MTQLTPEQPPPPPFLPVRIKATHETRRNSSVAIIGLVLASCIFSLAYHTIRKDDLGHTAMMFIGLPVVLAVLLALIPRPRSATGGIMLGIAVCMLVVAPLLGEGVLCIVIASPLFFGVGALVGVLVDWNRRKRGVTLGCCALVLLPMAFEGVVPQLTFNRAESVEVTRTIAAPVAAVEDALARCPRIDVSLPLLLRSGFPRPDAATGEGVAVGSLRTLHFTGAEGAPPGNLVVRVAAAGPGYLRTETVSDGTKLAQWLRLETSEVSWHRIDAHHTSVTWKVSFERELDPAWYFRPWQRLAVREVAEYMIVSNATPAGLPR